MIDLDAERRYERIVDGRIRGNDPFGHVA